MSFGAVSDISALMQKSVSREHAAIYAALDSPVLPTGTQVIRREGWYQIFTPDLREPSANEVMLSHLNDSEVEQRVEETFSLYRKHGLPFKWAIGPMSAPVRLEAVISKHAETSWGFLGMAIDSDASLPAAPKADVELVTPENFEEFLDVNLSGWDLREFRAQTEDKLSKMLRHPRC